MSLSHGVCTAWCLEIDVQVGVEAAVGLKETAEKVNNPHYYSTANGNTLTVSGLLKMLVVHVFNFNFEVLWLRL